MAKNVRIWDIPTRLFHWLLVAGIVAQWLTGDYLDDAIDWHFTIGYCVLGLILFRLVWGFVGTRYARFSHFSLHPKHAIKYAKSMTDKNSKVYAGHNPVGSWMAIVLLFIVLLQAVSGLFVSDDVFSEGPYRSVANQSVLAAMEFLHFNLFDVLLILIGLHVLAALLYQFVKKQAIISAMFSGKKAVEATPINGSKLVLAIVIAAMIAAGVYALVEVLPPEPELYF